MTKQEIYSQVVRLTEELDKTGIPESIFDAASLGDAELIDTIFAAFPVYYPCLYQDIMEFGWKYNELVGESAEDHEEADRLWEECASLMLGIAESNIIADVADAEETGDPDVVMDTIVDYKEQNEILANRLLNFQRMYNDMRNNAKTGLEGAIFGPEANEEDGIYVYNPNVINALSFYVFTLLANVKESYFFCNREGSGDYYSYPDRGFISAIAMEASGDFAEFVSCYSAIDLVGENKEFQTIGELLVSEYTDESADNGQPFVDP